MFKPHHGQLHAIPRMLEGNYFLSWEPGCGKTFPVVCAANVMTGPHLAIVPAHLREQWAGAVLEFSTLNPVVLERLNGRLNPPGPDDFVICSYEFASHLPRWKELRKTQWRTMTIDEAHYLSDLNANRTRAILGLHLHEQEGLVFAADCVWLLTGTPFQFPNQIYPILSRLFPSAVQREKKNGPGLMTQKEWDNAYCKFADVRGDDGKRTFGEKIVGANNVPDLRKRLEPVLDKLKLTDIASELPPLRVDEIAVKGCLPELTRNLEPEVIDAYENLSCVLGDEEIPDEEKLAALDDSGAVMAQLRHIIAVTKISPMVNIVKNEIASGVKKLLVFGWHRAPLQVLARELKAPLIFGDTTQAQRAKIKERFLDDPSCKILIGQISSIGTGVDGLQSVCHRSLFFEASWRYLENKQCIHRTYRKGQKRPCHASFVTLKGSVDEYVARVLKRNAQTIKSVLD